MRKLFLKTVRIVLDLFDRHHLAHIGTHGRVSDHRCSAAEKSDWTVSGFLHMHHCHNCKKMSGS